MPVCEHFDVLYLTKGNKILTESLMKFNEKERLNKKWIKI